MLEKAGLFIILILLPAISYVVLRRLFALYFVRRRRLDQLELEMLQERMRKKIEELKKTTSFDSVKALLLRYDPEEKKQQALAAKTAAELAQARQQEAQQKKAVGGNGRWRHARRDVYTYYNVILYVCSVESRGGARIGRDGPHSVVAGCEAHATTTTTYCGGIVGTV